MLNLKHKSDIDSVYKAIGDGTNDLVNYLNNGGLQTEGIFSSDNSVLQLFKEFDDFGSSVEISKRLSPVLEKGIAVFASKHLESLYMRLRQEDGKGYDLVLEHLDGEPIDYIELKITTRKQKDRVDLWTLNKNSLVKVPLHLLVGYKTKGSKISDVGVALCDATSAAVTRFVPKGNNHSFAQLRILDYAMRENSKFECLIGSLDNRRPKNPNKTYTRPYLILEEFA
jgi:hypothetical protein